VADNRLEFQSSKQVSGVGTFDGAVNASLKQFNSHRPIQLRAGKAGVIMTVYPHAPGEYFAVILAGPFANLETLELGLIAAAQETVPGARQLGIE
jgi:hypothetical protein